MLRAVVVLAVALATASSVWAQTPKHPRRPVPFDRQPVERVEAKNPDQAQALERPASKGQPITASASRSM
jgi:hypothetical protein